MLLLRHPQRGQAPHQCRTSCTDAAARRIPFVMEQQKASASPPTTIAPDLAARIASLSDTQRSYLALVAQGRTSKQIAQTFSGSYHTVNVEIGVAMRVLGARSRHEAAAFLKTYNTLASYDDSYDQLTLADRAIGPEGSGHGKGEGRDEEARGSVLLAPPWATRANRLTAWQRIGWIMVVAASAALLLGGLVSGIASLLVSLERLT